jgi:hypothetical protein
MQSVSTCTVQLCEFFSLSSKKKFNAILYSLSNTIMFYFKATCFDLDMGQYQAKNTDIKSMQKLTFLPALWRTVFSQIIVHICRSQLPCGLRSSSTAARLLRSLVRIPPEAWMFACICVVCQVEVSATSWSLIQRSPTDCGASLRVITKPRETRRLWPADGP